MAFLHMLGPVCVLLLIVLIVYSVARRGNP